MKLDINQFDLNNVADVTFSKSGDAYTLTSTASLLRFAFFSNPTKLPIGTKVKWSAEVKFISDYPGEISLAFFSDDQFTTGETFDTHKVSLDDANDDWQTIEITQVVPAGAQYVQGRIGSVSGSHTPGTDSFEFRNVQLEIDAGINTIAPELQESQTFGQSFVADDIENNFELFTAGAGTATRVSDTYELRATGVVGDEAMLTIDDVPTTAYRAIFQPNAKFVKVRVKALRNSGLPRIVVNFMPTYGSIASQTTKYAYLVADAMEWHEAIFAVPDGTDVITVFAGMDDNVLGSVDVDAIKISLLGDEASSKIVPFIGSLGISSGTWFIDDGVGVFGNIGITGISQNATSITINFSAPNTKPIFNVELSGDWTSGVRYATIDAITETAITIRLTESDGVIINPNLFADGSEIRILGFATI